MKFYSKFITIFGFVLMVSLVFTHNEACGQNMIRNESFEVVVCPDNTIGSFFESEDWNATGADAYWMHGNCKLDPFDIQSIVAIDTEIVPYHGSGYISLESLIFKNGFCLSEGVSQELKEPISKGSYYYVELGTLKYGLENPFEVIPSECFSFPDRGLEIRLDNKHITFDYDSKSIDSQPLICGYNSTSQLITDDIHSDDLPSSNKVWDNYWTCFEAEADYKYFSIVGPNKFFNVLNECMEEGLPGIQHVTGYSIDYIQLYEIPTDLEIELTLCREETIFSIDNFLEGPFIEKATFFWQDNVTGKERIFNEPGIFELNMVLSCNTFTITVSVFDENCNVEVYVPNVFSIYDQSPNNRVKPIMVSDYLIEDYLWSVYDRWGNLVFSSTEIEEYWYGTNSDLVAGVYIWKLTYAFTDDLIKEEIIGTITLLK